MRRVLLATGVVVVALVVFLARPWAGDNSFSRLATDGRSAEGRLDAGGTELRELLSDGLGATWHAKYDVTLANAPDDRHVLEVWRRGQRARHDVEITRGGQVTRSVSIRDGDRATACRKAGDAPWQCGRASGADVDATFAAAIGELGDRKVTARDDTVAGTRARCFVATGVPPDVEVCVSTTGVPLRIAGEGARIEVVSLDDEVGDSVFRPPSG